MNIFRKTPRICAGVLEAADLVHLRVPGDGACAYWSLLATLEDGLGESFWRDGQQFIPLHRFGGVAST